MGGYDQDEYGMHEQCRETPSPHQRSPGLDLAAEPGPTRMIPGRCTSRPAIHWAVYMPRTDGKGRWGRGNQESVDGSPVGREERPDQRCRPDVGRANSYAVPSSDLRPAVAAALDRPEGDL